jgi:NTP pyrophosphatase (non-canonical NTP hydrolase)
MTNYDDWRQVAKLQCDHCDAEGYWDRTDIGTHLAYLHSEVSELFDAYRKGPDKPCDKGIDLTAEEEECADIYLIFLSLVHKRGIDLAKVVRKKVEFNKTRPIKIPPSI